MAGLPLRLDGAVSAALFMMAREKPISWIRSAPGMVDGGGPSAAKATSGLVEHMTKSAWSNRSAMASFSWRRYASIEAARSRVNRLPRRFETEHASRATAPPMRSG